MSKLETNTIDTISGSSTLTIGSTNTTGINVGSPISNGLTLSDNILFDTADKGIYLGVTTATASNLLDDYEEGTFTPTLEVGTATSAQGSYIKIGNLVNVNIYIPSISDTSTSSAFRVDNLPFQAEASANSVDSTVGSVMLRYLDTGTDTQNLVSYVSHSDNRVQLYEIRDNTTYVTINHSNFTNVNIGLRMGVTYRTA